MPTTIRDYANDLVIATIERKEEHINLESIDKDYDENWEDIKEDLIDDFIETIKGRILG